MGVENAEKRSSISSDKKGLGRQHTCNTSCHKAAEMFPPQGRLCSGGFKFGLSKCDFCRIFHTERSQHAFCHCY